MPSLPAQTPDELAVAVFDLVCQRLDARREDLQLLVDLDPGEEFSFERWVSMEAAIACLAEKTPREFWAVNYEPRYEHEGATYDDGRKCSLIGDLRVGMVDGDDPRWVFAEFAVWNDTLKLPGWQAKVRGDIEKLFNLKEAYVRAIPMLFTLVLTKRSAEVGDFLADTSARDYPQVGKRFESPLPGGGVARAEAFVVRPSLSRH